MLKDEARHTKKHLLEIKQTLRRQGLLTAEDIVQIHNTILLLDRVITKRDELKIPITDFDQLIRENNS